MTPLPHADTLLDDAGRPVRLEERPLGMGGEGRVYALVGDPQRVAKLYHEPPAAAQARKLTVMAGLITPELAAVSAWPTGLLRGARGALVGFLMPRIDGLGARPLHDLTGPASRLEHFPGADYRFLVRAARNLAAAVATVHAHGQVIGDLNASNVYVTPQASVILVDTDSFQVSAAGERFLCPVGLPEFTPPELQGADLDRTPRTPEHDAYALATAIFQLLFLGHFPFSGSYEDGREVEMGQAIFQHHFAWGAGAAEIGLRPPPASPPLRSLMPAVADLFERTFGAKGGRPTATEWLGQLNRFEGELTVCARHSGHVHDRGTACPWCVIEAETGAAYWPGERTDRQPETTGAAPPPPDPLLASIEALWAEAQALPLPRLTPYEPPALPFGPHGQRLRQRRALWAGLVGALLAGGLWGAGFPLVGLAVAVAATLLALGLLGLAGGVGSARVAALEANILALVGQARDLDLYAQRLHSLGDLHAAALDQEQDAAGREQEAQQAYGRFLLARHLARLVLRPGVVPGLSHARLDLLRSHGVGTALDLEEGVLRAVPGLGEKTVQALLRWRAAFAGMAAVPGDLPDTLRDALRRQHQDARRNALDAFRQGYVALQEAGEDTQAERERLDAEIALKLQMRARLLRTRRR